ncbi:MAG: hypothetical protein VX642_04385 [Bdellovibrionota bacterium]|nr:hypothetical protein [Bdellovibrionota bacterium]
MKRNKMKTLMLLLSGLLATEISSATNVTLKRCERVKDINTRSLSPEENTKFWKWISKCNIDFAGELEEDGYITLDGKEYRLYPVFGVRSFVPDETRSSGRRVIYTNPRDYVPPFEKILKDPETAICDIPEDYKIAGWCRESCYTPDQKISFLKLDDSEQLAVQDVEILKAKKMQLNEILTLSPGTNLEELQNGHEVFQFSQLLAYVESPKIKNHKILDFVMKSGGKISVTPNHPLLNANGIMKEAADFELGNALLTDDGKADTIVAITPRIHRGKVYNVEVASTDLMENIVVAQGYLSGASRYQNELQNKLNRVLLRTSMIPNEFVTK